MTFLQYIFVSATCGMESALGTGWISTVCSPPSDDVGVKDKNIALATVVLNEMSMYVTTCTCSQARKENFEWIYM